MFTGEALLVIDFAVAVAALAVKVGGVSETW